MGQSIAIMNTKGGVGKSTVTMALAETLATFHGRNVLVIDSDSQTSISIMMAPMERWERMERERRTLVEYLSSIVLDEQEADWKMHVIDGVSDVDDARSVYLLASHMNLTLFEREVSAGRRHSELRRAIRNLLDEVSRYFDIVLIDCPPGLSVLTECWLRESDFYLPPTKADYLSVRGLDILKRFRDASAQHGFADLIGVLVNLKDDDSRSEDNWHERLLEDPTNRCFLTAVPRRPFLQRAADHDPEMRSFMAKYPGDAGRALKAFAAETLDRMSAISILRERSNGDDAAMNAQVDGLIADATRAALAERDALPPAPPRREPARTPPAAIRSNVPPAAQRDSGEKPGSRPAEKPVAVRQAAPTNQPPQRNAPEPNVTVTQPRVRVRVTPNAPENNAPRQSDPKPAKTDGGTGATGGASNAPGSSKPTTPATTQSPEGPAPDDDASDIISLGTRRDAANPAIAVRLGAGGAKENAVAPTPARTTATPSKAASMRPDARKTAELGAAPSRSVTDNPDSAAASGGNGLRAIGSALRRPFGPARNSD